MRLVRPLTIKIYKMLKIPFYRNIIFYCVGQLVCLSQSGLILVQEAGSDQQSETVKRLTLCPTPWV